MQGACIPTICFTVIVANSPGLTGTVRPMSRFSSNVPEHSLIALMEAWHKYKLSILASFGPYITELSGRGVRNLGMIT